MQNKTILSLLMLVLPMLLAAQTFLMGDANHSGETDIVDALCAAQYYVGLKPANFDTVLADVNYSREVNITDALMIAQYSVGLIVQFYKPNTSCMYVGTTTYRYWQQSPPTMSEQAVAAQITYVMDRALEYYNCNTNLGMFLNVYFYPDNAVSQAYYDVALGFGTAEPIDYINAIHLISHCAGVGRHPNWQSMVVNGVFTGSNATDEIRRITSKQSAVLYADSEHFWPFGLFSTDEIAGVQDIVAHCRLIMAIRKDLGL